MRIAEHRVNEEITAGEVRLILPTGEHRITSLEAALGCASEADLDLVEVAPNAEPPVCRIVDYEKFRYEQGKRARQAHRSRGKVAVKQIQLRPKTSAHHRFFKVRDARRWLEAGQRVRVCVVFQGREITYPEIGHALLGEVVAQLEDVSTITSAPSMEGRSMAMVLAPRRTATSR
jgi:translation initiation factor IF-3